MLRLQRLRSPELDFTFDTQNRRRGHEAAMLFVGMMGMPRRVYTYPTGMGWDELNFLSPLGAFTTAAVVLLLAVNAAVSMRRGRIAGANPWDAARPDWATSSPPPAYNFPHIPVTSASPLWDNRNHLPVMTAERIAPADRLRLGGARLSR